MKIAGGHGKIKRIFDEISEVARYLWDRGWAEKNAGNISVNITEHLSKPVQFDGCIKLKWEYPFLENNYFLITASGSKMRDIASNPYKNVLLLGVTSKGREYGIYSISKKGIFLKTSLLPTSELSVHLLLHNFFRNTNSPNKAILHTHSTELIALTHIKKFTKEKEINKLLKKMHPEIGMCVPEGIGLVPFMTSGTGKIADATLKAAKQHKIIIWEKHGCIASSENLSEAFDLSDIVSKAAEIYFKTK